MLQLQIGPKAFGNGLASLLQVAGPLGVAAVKLLLESGADATLQVSHRITALQRAEKIQEAASTNATRDDVRRLLRAAIAE